MIQALLVIFMFIMLGYILNFIGITNVFKSKEKQLEFPVLEQEIEELKEEIRKQERIKELEAERNRLAVELNGFKTNGELDYKKAYEYVKHLIEKELDSPNIHTFGDELRYTTLENIYYMLKQNEKNT